MARAEPLGGGKELDFRLRLWLVYELEEEVSVQLVSSMGGTWPAVPNSLEMERSEAEAIYDAGREAVVALLLRLDERVSEPERRLGQHSRNSSTPPGKCRHFLK